ncbi:aminotransferase class V-fold PLP-dependent enzyme [Akkermansiaceae bacterium]|nr:aminotransferase class V-fold PLP-dependent enzyme [Akkermansiaceae bacterium]MDB4789140.1 aminotransferase class V-fold PLP-dependent enzyme [Akkermansiaceae bacterium]
MRRLRPDELVSPADGFFSNSEELSRHKLIYLDNNSTTKPADSAIVGMKKALEFLWGNSSNNHSVGEASLRAIQLTASRVAKFIGIDDESSVGFVSGGTEANQNVIRHITKTSDKVAFLETEHSSVIDAYSALSSIEPFSLSVHSNGIINLKELKLRLSEDKCRAISIQWANSETGVIQPIGELLKLCDLYDAALHVDAAQAVGKIDLEPNLVRRIDYLTFTAHKLHGPQGVGIIITGDKQADCDILFQQSHTRNAPGIIAFGEVIQERLDSQSNHSKYLQSLRDTFETSLLALHPRLKINAAGSPRIPNTSNIQFVGVDGAALVARLDQDELMCSQVSACLTGRPEPSYVLTAMGVSEEQARSSVRFSFSILNTNEEVELAVKIISFCYKKLLKKSMLFLS